MIAVVGGRGVIGQAIVDALRATGRDVTVVTHNPHLAGAAGFRYGDMLHPDTLSLALEGAEVVLQSANFPSYPVEKRRGGHTFSEFDARGTERLVNASRTCGVGRYVYISGVGTRPDSPRSYFQALWRGERAVLDSGLEAVCLRPTFAYGPKDKGLSRILRAARLLPFVPVVGDGQQLHQPVFVEDIAKVAAQAAEIGAPQGTFDIGGPERMRLDDMLRRLFRYVGLSRALLHVPLPLARAGAAVLEKLPGPPLTVAAIDFIAEDFVADMRPLLSSFNLKSTQFEDGLSRYLPRHS